MLSEPEYRQSVNDLTPGWAKALLTRSEISHFKVLIQTFGSAAAVRQEIIDGNELPPDEVTDHDLVEAIVADGCRVGFDVLNDPDRDPHNSWMSYVIRNRAYRFLGKQIVEAANTLPNKDRLLYEWTDMETPIGSGSLLLIGPESIPVEKCWGLEKPVCFMACNLLKTLEAIRIGGLDKMTQGHKGNEEIFIFPWDNFKEEVDASENYYSLAARIGNNVGSALVSRGVSNDVTAQILVQGLDPRGRLREYGAKAGWDVFAVWSDLVGFVSASNADLAQSLDQTGEAIFHQEIPNFLKGDPNWWARLKETRSKPK